MSSDIAQQNFLSSATRADRTDETLELSRMQSFIDGNEDIFDVLAHKNVQERSRSMDAKIDMIHATKNKIFMSRQHRLLKGLLNA